MGMKTRLRLVFCTHLFLVPVMASAQTDEIEVYDASIAEVGQGEFTLHSNYTPVGRTSAQSPSSTVPDHSTNGALEFAYGLREYWELGLYLPVYTVTNDGTFQFDGVKLRTLWVIPHAREQSFFYGLNIEYSYNMPAWDSNRTTIEVRPIFGWHVGRWDFIVNPNLESAFDGIGQIAFAPEARIAYNVSDRWAYAVETYSDFGPIQHFDGWEDQSQQLFAVVDYTASASTSMELGIGRGFTSSSDPWVIKFIWNHAF